MQDRINWVHRSPEVSPRRVQQALQILELGLRRGLLRMAEEKAGIEQPTDTKKPGA